MNKPDFVRRCGWCGKRNLIRGFPFCSKEHQRKWNELSKQREKEKLCVFCAAPVFNDGTKKIYRVCENCGRMMTEYMETIRENIENAKI